MGAKFLEGCKTIVGASVRSRVGTDVMCDDFMQLERPMGVERVPRALRRLVAPPRAAKLENTGIQERDLSPVTKSQNFAFGFCAQKSATLDSRLQFGD